MKTFYFELPSKADDNKGFLKNFLINRIAKKYPFLTIDGIDGPKTESSVQYAGPGDYIAFNNEDSVYHVSAVYPDSWFKVSEEVPCFKLPFETRFVEKYNLLDEFDIAMKKLDAYAKSINCPLDKGYDYKWFGMPVRVYQNFIQIGMMYIPKKNNIAILPSNMTEKQKTTITNVIININTIINTAA
jgi:hypothetical protein